MRWQNLFADLEAELDAAEQAERLGEAGERTRVELARITWPDRLAATRAGVRLNLLGGAAVEGAVPVVGDGWAVVSAARRGSASAAVALVHLAAVTSVEGLARDVRSAAMGDIGRRLSFSAALRRVARDRSAVAVTLVDGRRLVGTLDAVGADHVDLAEHPPDEPRRQGRILRVLCLPLAAVAVVAPVTATSWA